MSSVIEGNYNENDKEISINVKRFFLANYMTKLALHCEHMGVKESGWEIKQQTIRILDLNGCLFRVSNHY